jgi:hypothetical protein
MAVFWIHKMSRLQKKFFNWAKAKGTLRAEVITTILQQKKLPAILEQYIGTEVLTVQSVLWIRIQIRINLYVLDSGPGPYWECGSGFRSMEYDQNLK